MDVAVAAAQAAVETLRSTVAELEDIIKSEEDAQQPGSRNRRKQEETDDA